MVASGVRGGLIELSLSSVKVSTSTGAWELAWADPELPPKALQQLKAWKREKPASAVGLSPLLHNRVIKPAELGEHLGRCIAAVSAANA